MIEYAWSDNEKRRSFNQIDLAVEMIHENYRNTDFNIEQIAKRLNLSDSYFRRQFLKAVGKRPKEYLLELRLQYACELLRSGYYSVSEVAYRCGFANVYYFSTFIKSRVGVSPSALLPGGGETANKIMDIRNRKIE